MRSQFVWGKCAQTNIFLIKPGKNKKSFEYVVPEARCTQMIASKFTFKAKHCFNKTIYTLQHGTSIIKFLGTRLSDARYKTYSHWKRDGKCFMASFSVLSCSGSLKDFRTNSADLEPTWCTEPSLPTSAMLISHCQPTWSILHLCLQHCLQDGLLPQIQHQKKAAVELNCGLGEYFRVRLSPNIVKNASGFSNRCT